MSEDVEMRALQRCAKALEPLDAAAKSRVLQYLTKKEFLGDLPGRVTAQAEKFVEEGTQLLEQVVRTRDEVVGLLRDLRESEAAGNKSSNGETESQENV